MKGTHVNGTRQTQETVCFVCSGTALQDEVYHRVDGHCSPCDSCTAAEELAAR
jgi:hypothetical protein